MREMRRLERFYNSTATAYINQTRRHPEREETVEDKVKEEEKQEEQEAFRISSI
jgi:hypothetical protein